MLLSQIGEKYRLYLGLFGEVVLGLSPALGIFPSLQGDSVRPELGVKQLVSAGECGIGIAWYMGRKFIYQGSEEA